jgi:FkbM family methyltransferase
MSYDFIEIGTADFDTEIQVHGNRKGLSIDIIQEYLDNLPVVDNVQKICCGISDKDGTVIAYKPNFPSHFPWWLRGCVSIIKPHNHVIDFCRNNGVDYSQYIETRTVPILSVKTFIEKYKINSVVFLKIDTEGHDCVILNAWLDYCIEHPTLLPKRILYESKDLTDPTELERMRIRLKELNYKLEILEYDTNAILIE